jgi:hypothetical protein
MYEGRMELDGRRLAGGFKHRLFSPWAAKSLSDSPHSNMLKDTYDYSCFLAR